ncbi:universal stress protein [Maribacter sp. X9]|uniref:universal stress protein n=1 Tax=Maribacter sp. X9 TaxID=3402159 RepID=UPI003AF403D8
MKNILVLTDFSTTAWNTTNYALHLFNEVRCTFYFLNTYTPEICSSRFMADTVQKLMAEKNPAVSSKKGLAATLRKIKINSKNPLHTYKTISSFSLLVDEVKETVADFDIDFIFMGTHGCSANEDLYLGRNTIRILKAIKNCPVFVIPKQAEFKAPKNIAFLTDFTHSYETSELSTMVQLTKLLRTNLRVIGVRSQAQKMTEVQHFNRTMLEKKLEGIAHSFHNLMSTESLNYSIQSLGHENRLDILMMSNGNHGFMDVFCWEFGSKRSSFYSRIPVLILPEVGDRSYSVQKLNTLSTALNK